MTVPCSEPGCDQKILIKKGRKRRPDGGGAVPIFRTVVEGSQISFQAMNNHEISISLHKMSDTAIAEKVFCTCGKGHTHEYIIFVKKIK